MCLHLNSSQSNLLGLSDGLRQILVAALPAISAQAYSNYCRRKLFIELRSAFANWVEASQLAEDSKMRRLEILGELVARDRKQVGKDVGEYSVPISELVRRAFFVDVGKAIRDDASAKLDKYLSAISASILAKYEQPNLLPKFKSHLLDTLKHKVNCNCGGAFCDYLPWATREFLENESALSKYHECWHWGSHQIAESDWSVFQTRSDRAQPRSAEKRFWDALEVRISQVNDNLTRLSNLQEQGGSLTNREAKELRTFLQRNSAVGWIVELGKVHRLINDDGNPDSWPQNWAEVFEYKAEDFTLEKAHMLSFALGIDPGNWEVPEPADARNAIVIAAVNAVHACVDPRIAADRVPLDPGITEDDPLNGKYGMGAMEDQYWGHVFEQALSMLRDGMLGDQLDSFRIFSDDID